MPIKIKPNQYTRRFTTARGLFSPLVLANTLPGFQDKLWLFFSQLIALTILQPIKLLLVVILYCVSTWLSWVDTQTTVYLISVEVILSLGDPEVPIVSKCTLKKIWQWRGEVEGGEYIEEWEMRAGKTWKRAILPVTREAAPSQPCPRLLITRKVHVLIGWELFRAAPTSVFLEADQPHHKRVKIFFLQKEKWIHCHCINFGTLDKDDVKRSSAGSEQRGEQGRKQVLNLSKVINDKKAP